MHVRALLHPSLPVVALFSPCQGTRYVFIAWFHEEDCGPHTASAYYNVTESVHTSEPQHMVYQRIDVLMYLIGQHGWLSTPVLFQATGVENAAISRRSFVAAGAMIVSETGSAAEAAATRRRTVVVTGALSNYGLTLVMQLGAIPNTHVVAVCATLNDVVLRVQDMLVARSASVDFLEADLLSAPEAVVTVAHIARVFGRVDAVVVADGAGPFASESAASAGECQPSCVSAVCSDATSTCSSPPPASAERSIDDCADSTRCLADGGERLSESLSTRPSVATVELSSRAQFVALLDAASLLSHSSRVVVAGRGATSSELSSYLASASSRLDAVAQVRDAARSWNTTSLEDVPSWLRVGTSLFAARGPLDVSGNATAPGLPTDTTTVFDVRHVIVGAPHDAAANSTALCEQYADGSVDCLTPRSSQLNAAVGATVGALFD
jgi:hypothetical protein